MPNKLLLSVFLIILLSGCHSYKTVSRYSQQSSETIVDAYASDLRSWCRTKDDDYNDRIKNQYDKACRINDEAMQYLAERNSLVKAKSYLPDVYLNALSNIIEDENLNMEFFGIRYVPLEMQSYESGRSSVNRKRAAECITVGCNMDFSGGMNIKEKNLIYIRNGKIVKIEPYVLTRDNKVRINFNDLYDDEYTVGATYNYAKHFPLGLSVFGSWHALMLGVDIGLNNDKDEYRSKTYSIKDIMNYSSISKVYDPNFFLTVTPGVYLKYVSIGCGVGFLHANTMETHEETSTSSDGSSRTSSQTSADAYFFMLRPAVKGYIPVARTASVVLGVAYDYAFELKDKNGFDFSIGMKFDF